VSPFEAAAATLGVTPSTAPVRDAIDIERAISELGRVRGSGLIVLPETFTTVHRRTIVAAAAQSNVPAIYPFTYMTRDGGLISYGGDLTDLYARAAPYIDRILKGATPADLPVQQPTKFEFTINPKTARTLGIEVPPTLLARADEVIE
jgi:putative tryptophan/tyrosine transport system substrate-binding protein